jgi:hypothetical protein
MTLAGSTVLVTEANRGLGRALVEEALRRGASRVCAGTRRPLAHPDGRVTPLPLDVTDAAQTQAAAERKEGGMAQPSPAPAGAVHRMVQAPGGRVHVADRPSHAPAVVLLHGFPDDSRSYDWLAPLLAPRRVVALDWLGYGRSDRVEAGPFAAAPISCSCAPCSARCGASGAAGG